MTVAVCLKCGDYKTGALTPCPSCRHDPKSLDEQAKHFMMTSHFRPEAELHAVARRVKAGEEVTFDPVQLEVIKAEIPRLRGWGTAACFTVGVFFLALAIALTAVVALFWWLLG